MRHFKYGHGEGAGARPVSNRMLAAAKRSIRREIEKHGLFGDQVQIERDPAKRCETTEAARQRWHEDARTRRAAGWRRARRLLGELPEPTRGAVYARWQTAPFPATPEYLANLVCQARRVLCHGDEAFKAGCPCNAAWTAKLGLGAEAVSR